MNQNVAKASCWGVIDSSLFQHTIKKFPVANVIEYDFMWNVNKMK